MRLICLMMFVLMTGCTMQQTASDSRPDSRPATDPSRISLRVASAFDLRPTLVTRVDPKDHFPICTLKVYNVSAEPVIVGYTPNCVTVHCGAFKTHGPTVTFVHRREILEPQQALELEIPAGLWTMSDINGERQLMIPTTLPAGRYETWASFQIEGALPIEILSKRDFLDVR